MRRREKFVYRFSKLKKILEDLKLISKQYFSIYMLRIGFLWPFEIINIAIALYVWYFYNVAFAKSVQDPLSYIILGLMVQTYLFNTARIVYNSFALTFFSNISIGGIRMSRYEHYKVMNISIEATLLRDILIGLLSDTFRAFLYLIVAVIFFNFTINPGADLILILTSLLFGFLAAIGMGLIATYSIWITGSIQSTEEPLLSILLLISNILCGVYFPIKFLPKPLQYLSYIFPQTYALKILRGTLLYGWGIDKLFLDLFILIIWSSIVFIIGVFLVKKSIRRILEGWSPLLGFE